MQAAYLVLPSVVLCLALSAPAAEKPARLDAAGDPLPDGAVARLGTPRFRTGEPIGAVALSPDGRLLAVAGGEEDIHLLDAATGKPVRRIKSDRPPLVLTFSPDGKLLAGTLNGKGDVQIWDTETGRARPRLRVGQGQVSYVAFSGDGKLLCGSTVNSGVKAPIPVWETATGKLVASLAILHGQPLGISLSADGKLLAVCGRLEPWPDGKTSPGEEATSEQAKRTIQLWDVAKGKELRRLVAPSGEFTTLALSPDGKTVAATWGTSTLTFWDTATGKELRRCAIRRGVSGLLFDSPPMLYSPDGKYLACVGNGGPIQMWDAATAKRLACYDDSLGPTNRVCFTAGGKALALSHTDKAVIIYDLLAGKLLTPAGGHDEAIPSLTFRSGGKELVSASDDGVVCVWGATGKELRRAAPRPDWGNGSISHSEAGDVILSPDGRHILTKLFGETRLLDPATGRTLLSLEDNGGGARVFPAAFSADSARFAIATLGGAAPPTLALRVYEVANGRLVTELAEDVLVTHVAFSPDGKTLATLEEGAANIPSKLRAWDLATGKQRWRNELPSEEARPLAFSPDGKLLACGAEKGDVTLYESATGRELRALSMPSAEAVSAVRFSPHGRLLAAAYTMSEHKPSRLRVWEMATGTVRHEFTGHLGEVASLCFAPDSKRLASGSADTTVLLWDLTGRAGEEAPKEKPGVAELDKLWAALADPDARPAHRAMSRLKGAPDEAVALLAKHVKPEEGKGDDTARLIAALDDDSFDIRQAAHKRLAAMGKGAEAALKKALADKPSAEAKRAIEDLLEKLKDKGAAEAPPPDLVRGMRAVEVLEDVGTPEARKLLQELANGGADAPLTTAAKEALERLERPGKP